jgi:hypothetical protein
MALQKRRIADTGLLIAACHHIIAEKIHPLGSKVTHKPDEQCRKNKLCIIAFTSLLAVGTNSFI